jgi:TP901 family phage tail tape measure protein
MATKKLEVVIAGDAKGAQAAFGSLDDKLGAIGKSMGRMGRTMTTKVTLPIVAAGALMVKTYADFDTAMTNSLAIQSGVTGEMRDRMEKVARDIAKTTTFSAAQAAEGYYFLASAGLTAEQQIAALPRVAAFAAAGNFDLARATDLATDAQSALGLTSEDTEQNLANLTRTTDVFSRASQLANASVEQFAVSMTNKAGAALRNTGKSIEEGTAVLAVFADQGIKAEQAGTMLATTLADLPKAAVVNAESFEEFGVQVFDSAGNLNHMADIVDSFTESLGPMSDAERAAALQAMGLNKQVADSIRTLLDGGDAIRTYEEELLSAGGATQEVADKQLESFSAKMQILKSQFEDIALDLAPLIIDNVIAPFARGLERLSSRLQRLTPQQRKWILGIAGAAAAMGPLLIVMGKVVSALGVLVKVFAAVASPVGLAVVAVALLAGGMVYAYQRVEWFRDAVDAVASFITGTFIPGLQDLWSWFNAKVLPVLADVASFLAGTFMRAFRIGRDWVGKLIERVGSLVRWFRDDVLPQARAVAGYIGGAFVWMFGGARDAIGWVIDKARDLVGWFRDHVEPTARDVANVIGAVLSGAFSVASTLATPLIMALQGIKRLLEDIAGVAGSAADAIARLTGRAGTMQVSPNDSWWDRFTNYVDATRPGGGRATGGSVVRGRSVMVGETGPELFTPPGNGVIVPTRTLRAGGSTGRAQGSGGTTVVHVTVQGTVIAERDLAESVRRALIDTGRRSGRPVLGGVA